MLASGDAREQGAAQDGDAPRLPADDGIELEDDVADAEAFADLGRAEKARAERDFIATELAAALGLDGRPRRTGDPAERARKAVAGRIRLTIGRIDEEAPDLARHLANAVHTGTFCVYRPEIPIDWTV